MSCPSLRGGGWQGGEEGRRALHSARKVAFSPRFMAGFFAGTRARRPALRHARMQGTTVCALSPSKSVGGRCCPGHDRGDRLANPLPGRQRRRHWPGPARLVSDSWPATGEARKLPHTKDSLARRGIAAPPLPSITGQRRCGRRWESRHAGRHAWPNRR